MRYLETKCDLILELCCRALTKIQCLLLNEVFYGMGFAVGITACRNELAVRGDVYGIRVDPELSSSCSRFAGYCPPDSESHPTVLESLSDLILLNHRVYKLTIKWIITLL